MKRIKAFFVALFDIVAIAHDVTALKLAVMENEKRLDKLEENFADANAEEKKRAEASLTTQEIIDEWLNGEARNDE